MTEKLCKNCKHLETDGMFGIFCGVGGDNTKYDCLKFEKAKKITEKRFTDVCGCETGHIGFTDNGIDKELTGSEFEDFLNEQHEEKEQLQSRINDYDVALKTLQDLTERKLKENERLQQYICDNLGEDICDVCSYQYLEKSDKYYVAKCKKGYDNCSKGTVIHCKDFKFKELEE